MASITLSDVSKSFDCGQAVVDGLTLDVRDGEFMVLVGPSGCGKTTALRMIAGLETPTDGTISIGERVVDDVAPKNRDIAMVFQNYALYPHMDVENNMAFALRLRGVERPERRTRVERVAAVLGLDGLLDRRPRQLSGGQRQRVAMGRAIVREPRTGATERRACDRDDRSSSWTSRSPTSTPSCASACAARCCGCASVGRQVIAGIRPSDFRGMNGSSNGALASMQVNIDVTEPLGTELNALFTVAARSARHEALDIDPGDDDAALGVGGERSVWTATLDPDAPVLAGESATLCVDMRRCQIFDPDTGQAIA